MFYIIFSCLCMDLYFECLDLYFGCLDLDRNGTRDQGPGPGPGSRDQGRDQEPGTRAGTRDQGPGPGPGTRDQGPGPGPGTKDQGPGTRAGTRDEGPGPGPGPGPNHESYPSYWINKYITPFYVFELGVPNQRACGASPTSEKTRPWNFGPCTLCILSFCCF